MNPEGDPRLRGTREPDSITRPKTASIRHAIDSRPDLLALRAAEQVAGAKLKQAQTEARPNASVSANYQRMDSGFNVNGLTAAGQQRPVQGIFHNLTAGVSITLPVRNRNQGAIEMAVAQIEEGRRRREYMELIVSREVAAAFLVLEKAKESLEIYRKGVRDQASQNLEVIRKINELGRTQLLDVIAEQRRFIDAENAYTESFNL